MMLHQRKVDMIIVFERVVWQTYKKKSMRPSKLYSTGSPHLAHLKDTLCLTLGTFWKKSDILRNWFWPNPSKKAFNSSGVKSLYTWSLSNTFTTHLPISFKVAFISNFFTSNIVSIGGNFNLTPILLIFWTGSINVLPT